MSDNHSTPDDVVDELQTSWRGRAPLTVEELLQKHPHLASSADLVMDLIYSEVLLREEHGETVEEAEYIGRFPQLREEISRQFQVHRALAMPGVEASHSTEISGPTIPSRRDSVIGASEIDIRIPGFDILGVAGRGGSGVAYRAYDQKLKRIVAIKLVSGIRTGGDLQRQQLTKEAEAAASLVHPSIVQVYHIGEVSAAPYFVMEYVDGGSLAERLRDGPLPVREAVDLVIEVARAVEFAHEHGVIHRDLKPGNVLLDSRGVPHVCDFGLARQMDSEFTLHATGDVVGTPAYMPPEQARGDRATPAADVYSLGAILYHTLTGRPPFEAATPWEILSQVMADDPVAPRQLNVSVPRDLDTICCAALRKSAQRRISSAGMLADELDRFRTGQPIQSRPIGRPERLWKFCRRNAIETVMIGIALTALMGATIVSTVSKGKVDAALRRSENALQDVKTQRDVAYGAMTRLVYEVHDDLRKREASVEARGAVLLSAIDGLQELIDTNGDHDDLRLTMSIARSRYGFILTQQGRNEEAEQEYHAAIELAETIATPAGVTESAQGYCDLAAYYLRVVEFDKAISASQNAIRIADPVIAESPDNQRLRLVASRVRAHLSVALTALGKPEEGLEIGLEALGLDRQAGQDWPDDRSVVTQLADINLQVGGMLLQAGRTDEAEKCILEAIPLIKREGARSTEDAEVSRRLYAALQTLATAQVARLNYDDAIANLQEAINGYQHLADVEPNRPGFRLKLGGMHYDLCRCLIAQGQLDEAMNHAEKQVVEFTRGMELGGEAYRVQRYAICRAIGQIADLQIRKNDLLSAAKSLRRAADVVQPIVAEYNAEGAHANIVQIAEILFGIVGEASQADSENIERTRRALTAWQAEDDESFHNFATVSQQLQADIAELPDGGLKVNLANLRAMFLGRYFQWLSNQPGANPADVEQAALDAIDAIRHATALPDADPAFYLYVPDFQALRQTDAFRKAMDQDP